MRFGKRSWRLDTFLLFLFTTILIFPLWRLNYLNNWSSIESTFIADARMLRENWPHHLWQPLWYCGTRANYVYPPGLSSGVAMLSLALHASFAHAYHILIALFYATGIVAVYLWARTGTGLRSAGWLAAIGVAFLSPCFLFFPDVRLDSPDLVPWRLHVLMTYGEGPHISSLSLLPLVWLTAWRRFLGGGLGWLFLSAGAAAAVVTINFYGATALAISFSLLLWSCWLEKRDWRIFRDGFAICALAYSLTAWWLVPSFLQITTRNLRLVSPPGNSWSFPVFCGMVLTYLAATLALCRFRRVAGYSLFVWSGLAFLSAYTLGYRWFGFQIAGNSARLLPELDVFAILCGVAILQALWESNRRTLRILACGVLLLCASPSWSYVRDPYREFARDSRWRDRVEYKTANWLQQHFPNRRVFVTGTIRFWNNAWFNVPQVDGGSMQGILNPLISIPSWRIHAGSDPEHALYWLQALGVDILVVPGATSQEPYKDIVHPEVYTGWSLLRDDGEGNRYYNIPRRAPGIVRIVDRARMGAVPAIPADNEKTQIRAYADAVETLPPGGDDRERSGYHWNGSDQWEVEAEVQPGESLLLQENYDAGWKAFVDGQAQTIRRDALGFMLIELLPGKHSIRLVFETPAEIMIGRLFTLTTVMALGALAWARRRMLFLSRLS